MVLEKMALGIPGGHAFSSFTLKDHKEITVHCYRYHSSRDLGSLIIAKLIVSTATSTTTITLAPVAPG